MFHILKATATTKHTAVQVTALIKAECFVRISHFPQMTAWGDVARVALTSRLSWNRF